MRIKLMAHWRQNLSALIEIQKTREYAHETYIHPECEGTDRGGCSKPRAGPSSPARAGITVRLLHLSFQSNRIEFPRDGFRRAFALRLLTSLSLSEQIR